MTMTTLEARTTDLLHRIHALEVATSRYESDCDLRATTETNRQLTTESTR